MNNIYIPSDPYQSAPPVQIDILKYLQAFYGLLLIILASWSLVELLLGLFHWVTSGQDMEKKTLAKARALKGLKIFILTFVIWGVTLFVQSIFGPKIQ